VQMPQRGEREPLRRELLVALGERSTPDGGLDVCSCLFEPGAVATDEQELRVACGVLSATRVLGPGCLLGCARVCLKVTRWFFSWERVSGGVCDGVFQYSNHGSQL
jgi:hypothetical protein